ncbi:hypothetical protein BKA57DRAFT_515296 [Linnemannia elongata]|nr:hypothetical protein BKA57DRAFT_515296 [Linnemannia elongata]
MAIWSTAFTQGVLLFRALGKQDDSSQGIYPRDSYTALTVDEHITKGPISSIGSRYISTTCNINLAVNMAIKRCSTLAIIICALLDQDIELLDLSSGHNCLTQDSNNTTIALSEVLLRPYINIGAIFTVPYEDLYCLPDDAIYSFRRHCYRVARGRCLRQRQCYFCNHLGHDDDDCAEYDAWIVEEGEISRYLSL